MCDFKDNPQVFAQVGFNPLVVSICSILAFIFAAFCYYFTAFELERKKKAVITASLGFLASLSAFIFASTFSTKFGGGSVLIALSWAALGVYSLYLVIQAISTIRAETAAQNDDIQLSGLSSGQPTLHENWT